MPAVDGHLARGRRTSSNRHRPVVRWHTSGPMYGNWFGLRRWDHPLATTLWAPDGLQSWLVVRYVPELNSCWLVVYNWFSRGLHLFFIEMGNGLSWHIACLWRKSNLLRRDRVLLCLPTRIHKWADLFRRAFTRGNNAYVIRWWVPSAMVGVCNSGTYLRCICHGSSIAFICRKPSEHYSFTVILNEWVNVRPRLKRVIDQLTNVYQDRFSARCKTLISSFFGAQYFLCEWNPVSMRNYVTPHLTAYVPVDYCNYCDRVTMVVS